MRLPSFLVVAASLIIACGESQETSIPVADGGSGGIGGVGGQGGEQDVGCAVDVTWTPATDNAPPRDHHGTFAFTIGGVHHLYVTGGTNYMGVFDDVWTATVDDAGQMSPWESLDAMPSSRAGHGVATRGERVFLAAGRTAAGFLATVIAADVGADGGLSPWSELTPLPESRFHLAMVEHRDHLYVTGGLAQATQAATDTVFSVAILADGTLGEWVASTLPEPRSHHASFVFDDYLYVAGGLSGQPAGFNTSYSDVKRAAIGADGSLGAWESAGELNSVRVTHAAMVRGSCVYFLGGLAGSERKADCEAHPIDAEGLVGPGAVFPSMMPNARSHTHHVGMAGDMPVVMGGSVELNVVTGATAVGSFVMP